VEIAFRLARELNAVLLRTDVRDQIGKQGLEVQTSTPTELTEHTREQYQAWMRIIREANIPQDLISENRRAALERADRPVRVGYRHSPRQQATVRANFRAYDW
jgi:hypothetical protein